MASGSCLPSSGLCLGARSKKSTAKVVSQISITLVSLAEAAAWSTNPPQPTVRVMFRASLASSAAGRTIKGRLDRLLSKRLRDGMKPHLRRPVQKLHRPPQHTEVIRLQVVVQIRLGRPLLEYAQCVLVFSTSRQNALLTHSASFRTRPARAHSVCASSFCIAPLGRFRNNSGRNRIRIRRRCNRL